MSSVYFSTSKRSSCDRCRKQKLRCPTKEDTNQPCSRCLRAGVPCVMGYTRPRGRTPRNSVLQDNEDPRKPQHSAVPTPTSLLSTSLDRVTEETSTQSLSLLEDYGFFHHVHASYEPGQTQTHDDGIADIDYFSICRDLEIEGIHTETLDFSQDAFSTSVTGLASPDPDGCCMLTGASDFVPDPTRQMECEMRLSQLNLDLCRQLNTQIVTPTSNAIGAVQNHNSNTPSAIRGVLQSTESYVHILQSLYTCSTTPTSPDRSGTSIGYETPSELSPLPFSCVLNLTSCFFRIVDLFNTFLGDLAREIDAYNLVSRSNGMQILSELKLTGLPVYELSLQVKILVLAITHHFETIERLLDLPAELRVSLQQDKNTSGLLPGHWTATLLSAKCELVELGCHGTGNYVQSIQLLRRNIMRFQRMS